jgi:hypothetical protein
MVKRPGNERKQGLLPAGNFIIHAGLSFNIRFLCKDVLAKYIQHVLHLGFQVLVACLGIGTHKIQFPKGIIPGHIDIKLSM